MFQNLNPIIFSKVGFYLKSQRPCDEEIFTGNIISNVGNQTRHE